MPRIPARNGAFNYMPFIKGYIPYNKGIKGKFHFTEKSKEKMSEARFKNPIRYWLGKKRPNIGLFLRSDKNPMKRPEMRKLVSERMKRNNPQKRLEVREKNRIAHLGNKNNLGKHWKVKDTSKMKGHIPWNKGKKLSEEHRKKLSEKKLNQWKEDKYVKMMMMAHHLYPNKPETFLSELLNNLIPNEYKYVGDGQCIIGGKCPDFLNINGQKKLIELYGDYWHRGQNEQDRIDYFKQYGFDTLIIWERELKNMELLRDKITQYNA